MRGTSLKVHVYRTINNFADEILRNFELEADDRKRDEDSNSFSY